MDLSKTRCIACSNGAVAASDGASAVTCFSCGAIYDVVEGVPAIVRYQPNEALSLIEILSIVGDDRAPPSAASYRNWALRLAEYDAAEDREAYLDGLVGGFRQYLPHRHRQFEVMQALLGSLDLNGKKVLDVGAGEGFDTALLEAKGAKVTALEFSPFTAARGAVATPNAQWFIGSGNALPFEDETFDAVVCQATLHHMVDIPQSMREMLRVLKVGGYFISISDSFRHNQAGEDYVCRRFNDDVAVLSGVNENIPKLSEITETLVQFKESLEPSFMTTIVYGLPKAVGGGGART